MHTVTRAARARRASRSGIVALLVATGVVGAGGLAAPASAAPRTVDPLTMTPALNPNFAPWTCLVAGTGIVCRGSMDVAYEAEPIGLTCPTGEVVVSGRDVEHMTRWHTATGLATRTEVNVAFPADVLRLADRPDGPSLTIRSHFNRHYDYLVPGELGSRVLTETGAIAVANQPGSGRLLHDTGWVTYQPGLDHEVVASSHGVHDTLTDLGAIDALVCAALG